MPENNSVTTLNISTRSKVALVTLITASVLGSVYYNKYRRGKKPSEIDPKDKLIDDNSLYNDFVASLPDSFTLIDNSTDSFISKIFSSSAISMPSIIPTSFEELKEQMNSLYPHFENQLETIRDMYKSFWEFLSLEEFKNIVRESLKEDDDPELHPEIKADAQVREGQDLSKEEIEFVRLRKQKMKAAFAFFIGVDEHEVEIEDIPNIGIASSGGGYRAMVGCSGYLHAMIETGILDCVLYMAGVSGSTWAMSQFYSPLSDGSSKLLKDHLCSRIHTHIANLSNFLTVLNASRHNSKIILHGIIQRYYQQKGTINLVDIFGMLLGGTLLARTLTIGTTDEEEEYDFTTENSYRGLAEDETKKPDTNNHVDNSKTVEEDDGSIVKPKLLHRSEIKLSKQRAYFEDGSLPMPIYCAVRHEIGIPNVTKEATISNQDNIEPCREIKMNDMENTEDNSKIEDRASPSIKSDNGEDGAIEEESSKQEDDQNNENTKDEMKDLYQWFEFTPYDMGSEEINAWIPIWSFGRKFEEGRNTERLPEQSLGILMGMFGSAFVASLAHFYQEIRMILPSSAVEKADEMINSYRSSVSTIHPISPASFPNPFYKMTPKVQTKNEDECVEEILRTENLVNSEQIGLMDAGMDNNIPFYPLLRKGRDVDIILSIDLSADIQDAPYFDRAEGYVKRRGIKGWPQGAGWPKPKKEKETSIPTQVNYQQKKKTSASDQEDNNKQKYALDTCTVFASSSSETTPASGNKSTTTYPENVNPVTLVYFPLIVNPNYDPDFDPQTAEFCSTWNFVYSTEQVNKLHGLAEANIKDNLEKVRKVFKETWKRKRDERLKQNI